MMCHILMGYGGKESGHETNVVRQTCSNKKRKHGKDRKQSYEIHKYGRIGGDHGLAGWVRVGAQAGCS